jgi:hypothetical protein
MSLQENIERAFADVPYPGHTQITAHRCPECDEIADYFRDTAWRGHSIEHLGSHASALALFTPEAYRYFLPGFMLATLENPQAADAIAGNIVFGFFSTPEVGKRLALFNSDQRDAVVGFLRHLAGSGLCSEYELNAALQTLS